QPPLLNPPYLVQLYLPKLFSPILFLSRASDLPDLHSFPTRRSSDLRRLHGPAFLYGVRDPLQQDGRLHRQLPSVHEHPEVYARPDRKSTRLNSSHVSISYAVFCLKKKRMTQSLCTCTSQICLKCRH